MSFARYKLLKSEWPWTGASSSQQGQDSVIGLPIYAFLLMFNSNICISLVLYKIYDFKIWVTLNLTFQGHSRSNVTVLLDSPYAIPLGV